MSDSGVKPAVVDRFRGIAQQYERNEAEIKRLTESQELLKLQAQDCYATARLFGFDLVAAVAAQPDISSSPPQLAEAPPPPAPITPNLISVQRFVRERAAQAYPSAVKASVLRAELAKLGREVHEKTIGMTLYRLSLKHVVKRDGVNWFFVPEEERPDEEKADA